MKETLGIEVLGLRYISDSFLSTTNDAKDVQYINMLLSFTLLVEIYS